MMVKVEYRFVPKDKETPRVAFRWTTPKVMNLSEARDLARERASKDKYVVRSANILVEPTSSGARIVVYVTKVAPRG